LYVGAPIAHAFMFVFRLVYTMLPDSLDCPFVIAPNVYKMEVH
jgi:hypothetical protein